MHILGVHLDFPFTRRALIRTGRRGIEIQQLDTEVVAPNVKRLYIAAGLSAKDFLTRSIELKMAGSRHVEEAIAFQSEATSHFKPEEVMAVPLLQKKEKGVTEALLFTVPRDAMRRHLLELEKLEIDPDSVSTTPSALCHFVRWKFPKLSDALIIDLGSSETTCASMENGQLKKTHSIPLGIENLLTALFEDRKKILLKKEIEGAAKQIDLLLLKPGLNPHLTANLNELKQELAKVHYRFCQGKNPVIFTGRTDAFTHLKDYLLESDEKQWPLSLEEQKFAIGIGLAIEQTTAQPLQLRRDEFFPKKNWSRMGFYAVALLSASIVISGALLGFGVHSTSSRKERMLQSLQVSEAGLEGWISAIEKNNKEYSYILQAPKVVEVFSWLSSHPLLEELKKEGDPIDIHEIRYQLVSYPKIGSSKEPYLAKVEMEFQFKNGTNGRKFHEALRKGDDRVDPNLEVTWDALNNGYRASFFLKNRGPYVP